MNCAVVFPPSLCLPNVLYLALPFLGGALRDAGHRVRLVDLNLLAADMLLEPAHVDRVLAMGRQTVAARARAGTSRDARALAAALDRVEPGLRAGPRAKAALRDRERFFDKAQFGHAFWTVVDDLAFLYQLDPLVSPHREDFGAAVDQVLRADAWSPLKDLYAEGLIDAVLANDPELVALCIAFPEQSCEAVRLARALRARNRDLVIVAGGPLVALHVERWLQADWVFDAFDGVCLGDGAQSIVEIADAVERCRDLHGITNLATRVRGGAIRRPDRIVLDDLDRAPLPDFGGADLARAFTPAPIYPLMTARGCYWGKCTFCSIGWRENYRTASDERIAAEVRNLVENFGARWCQVQDSSLPPKNARRLAQAVQDQGAPFAWVAGMKFDRVLTDPEYCDALHAGGCRSLMLGFESASQRLVDLMDKGFKVADVPAMLARLRGAGISAELLWFLGFPGETHREAADSLEFLRAHKADYGLNAFVSEYQMHPDTEVSARPAAFGVTVSATTNGSSTYAVDTGMTPEETLLLKRAVHATSHRTLVCNGSHLPHLAERGIDLSGLERGFVVPDDVVAYCDAADVRAHGGPARGYFDVDFGFRARLEAAADVIAAEWRALPRERLVPWPQHDAYDGAWTVFGLFVAGNRVDENCALCPETARVVASIPGMCTAGFSVLGGGTTLPLHRGLRADVLRCHLAIDVPPDCALALDGEIRAWVPGKTLVFDDTLPHAAWNRSTQDKVILLIDFLRPESVVPKAAGDRMDRRFYGGLFPDWTDA